MIHEFILPGKSIAGAHLHLCRSVCRRAERLIVRLNEDKPVRPGLLKYVNRLSDLLYILARAEDDFDQKEKLVDEVVRRYQEKVGK